VTNYRISDRIGDVTDDTAVLVQPHRTPSEVIAFNRVNRESRVRGGIRVSVRVRVRVSFSGYLRPMRSDVVISHPPSLCAHRRGCTAHPVMMVKQALSRQLQQLLAAEERYVIHTRRRRHVPAVYGELQRTSTLVLLSSATTAFVGRRPQSAEPRGGPDRSVRRERYTA